MLLYDGIIILVALTILAVTAFLCVRTYAEKQKEASIEAANIKEINLNDRKAMQLRADEQLVITRGQLDQSTIRLENEIMAGIPKEKDSMQQLIELGIEMVKQNPQILQQLMQSDVIKNMLPMLKGSVEKAPF